jgi:signal peptidase II
MGCRAQGGGVATGMSIGPFSRFGLVVALATAILDQVLKYWLIFEFDLGRRGRVIIAPFLDLVLAFNTGISFSLFRQSDGFGRWMLIILAGVAVVLLCLWLARVNSWLTALSIGLIVGGAVGNAIDRLAYGAVADFVLFHITTATFDFNWAIFNLADAAIVAGVLGLLYESLPRDRAAKAPRSRP